MTSGYELCREIDKIINGHAVKKFSIEAKECALKAIDSIQKIVADEKNKEILDGLRQEVEALNGH